MSPQAKIAILGAGPGGLTLANILSTNRIPFTIFEAFSTPRSSGGTLDLHPAHGQAALKAGGLWSSFVKVARPESDVMKIVKLDGEVLWDGNTTNKHVVKEGEEFDHRPEVDREKLLEILLENVKGSVKWGKKAIEVVENAGGKWDLRFEDESSEAGYDLVVGADGAWSKVRKVLTDIAPYYSGISSIELLTLNVDVKNPWMSQYAGMGSCFSFGEGRAIQIQRLGDGSLRTYASVRQPETWIKDCGIDWTSDNAREELVKGYFADCGEDLKRMILESKDSLTPRSLYMLPVGIKWENKKGVTLVGDAAHLMTPFAGVGVNAAMADALELGKSIVSFVEGKSESLEKVVEEYEKELFERGEKFAQKTMQGLTKHFSARGGEHMAGRLREAYGNA
ncbi:hypothetical protein B7494_g899 [Chlorociboria aeruginascens]|nr:hypothetical protein B7494_g899 [Chlorociboria aeruginascens]